MGLVKASSLPLVLLSLLAAPVASTLSGCKSDKRGSVSSEAFLAPQLVGVSPGGRPAVEVVVGKLDILREVYRDPITGEVPLPGALLQKPSPLLVVLGKLDRDRLLIYEGEQKLLLTVDLSGGPNAVKVVLARDLLLALLKVPKPLMRPIVTLQNGWILIFERTSKSLFAVRRAPSGTGVLAVLVLDQKAIQNQIFPPSQTTKPTVTIAQMVEFQRDQLLVIPEGNITAIHHLQITERSVTLEARFVVPGGQPLLTFEQIKAKTGNLAIDIKDFPPIRIPGTSKVLIFDRARETSSFLTLDVKQSGSVFQAVVDVVVNRDELSRVVQQSSFGGEPFAGQFKFTNAFLHADADLEAGNPLRRTQILAFESETNNLIAYDWTKPRNDPGRAFLFSSSSQISDRTDLNRDPEIDVGTFDPEPMWAGDDILNNKLVFDGGPDELIALNYETGQFVVVAHKRDIGTATGVTLLDITYLEALDDNEIRLVDSESSSVVAMRLEYLPIPVNLTRE